MVRIARSASAEVKDEQLILKAEVRQETLN